jgi:hypothetical protein
MSDPFTSYETGLKRLLERLGSDHPRYADALVYQQRLQENIAQARGYGDTETRRAERAQIVDGLNRLALEAVNTSFNELCGLGQDEPVLTVLIEPPDSPPPPSPPTLLTEEPPVTIPRRTWGLLALLVFDFCLVILWGWCLIGDQPNLMAYLQTVFTIVGVLFTIAAVIFVMRRPVTLESVLHCLGTNRGWRYIILGLSIFIFVATLLFWPLGWVGKCRHPPPTPTNTPTAIVSLTPTLAITPTSTPDCSDVQVSYLELDLLTGTSQYPENGVIKLTRTDIAKNLTGRAVLTIPNVAGGCMCKWGWWINGSKSSDNLSKRAENCSFSIDIPDQVTRIQLRLTVDSKQLSLFTIEVSE